MSESLYIPVGSSKKEKYLSLLPQIEALISGEEDTIANLANISAALKEASGFFWVGLYLVKHSQLVLGPFQGPIACTRIGLGKGVCGTVWKEGRTLIVPDVDVFPGHNGCNAASKAEVVSPTCKERKAGSVLYIAIDQLEDFEETDEAYLEQVMRLVEWTLGSWTTQAS